MRSLVAMVFLIAGIAHAEVFKCVDPSTGQMTFTDTACPDKGTGDYVPVQPANGDSAYATDLAKKQHQEAETARVRLAEGQEEKERRERESRRPEVTRCSSSSHGSNNVATRCVTKTLSPTKKKDKNYLSGAELAREDQRKRQE